MCSDAASPSGRGDLERRGLGRLRTDPLQDEAEVRSDRVLHAQLGHGRRDREGGRKAEHFLFSICHVNVKKKL